MLYSDYGYKDPVHIVWRKGTIEDPYIEIYESLLVVNDTIVLSEIPDRFNRVHITGLQEVISDGTKTPELKENEFLVNYVNGVIQFNSYQNAKTLNVYYKGKGFIQYPSSRIYHRDKFNNVVKSLNDIIEQSLDSVTGLQDEIELYKSMMAELNDALMEAELATDNANKATTDAEMATEKALDAHDSTKLVFLPYVNTYNDIVQNYPNAQLGYTVQVYDTGIRYRYDGTEWIPIDLFGGNIPLADETRDGLMPKESYQKIYELDALPKERVIVFNLPFLDLGQNSIVARFPFSGTIQEVKALCSTYGETMTEIDIEKSVDMINWSRVFTNGSYLTFNPEEFFINQAPSIAITNVNEGDLFRVFGRTVADSIRGVTIEIKILVN